MFYFKKIIFLFSLTIIALPVLVRAQDPCLAYQNTVPLPEWYAKVCSGPNRFRSVVGGGFSSYADALNLNPATLPTHSLPLGAEVLFSKKSGTTNTGTTGVTENQTTAQFSLIKGMEGYGLGFSSDADDTIYSNRPTAGKNPDTNVFTTPGSFETGTLLPNLNFGTALSLESVTKKISGGGQANLAQYLSPSVGAIMKYSQKTQNWSPGFGMTVNAVFFSFGFSYAKESKTVLFPEATVFTFNFGARIKDLQFEFVRILNQTIRVGTVTQVYTASLNLFGILWSAALRDSQDYVGGSAQIFHLAAKYNFTKKVSLGYLYNYVPGAHSASLQVMF